MSTLRAKTHIASFRGFPFLVTSETKTGGKKIVSHEYINSNKRFTEELGELPPKFTIQAVLHGDNAILDRIIFEEILNQPGLGEFVHPIYGSLLVKSTTYSVSSSQSSIGEFLYSINFEQSEDIITTVPDITSPAQASSNAAEARKKLDNSLEGDFLPPTKPSSLRAVADKADEVLKNVSDKIKEIKPQESILEKIKSADEQKNVFDTVREGVNKIQAKVAEFSKAVELARSKINLVVQTASTIKGSVTDLYASALQIVNTPADLFDAWKDLTDFGFLKLPTNIFGFLTKTTSDSDFVDTTERKEIDNNQTLLDEHTRLTALVNVYEASAFKEYKTDEDISEVREFLNTAYNKQVELFIVDKSGNTLNDNQLAEKSPMATDPEVRQSIQKLRTTVNKILDEKTQTVWRVETIESNLSSMPLTSYRFYGDIDNLSILENLNPSINSSNFSESIKVVSK